jgi:hypothetical protein
VSRRFVIAVVKEGHEYWSFVLDVPGVFGRGSTSPEAVSDVTDALSDYLTFVPAAQTPFFRGSGGGRILAA